MPKVAEKTSMKLRKRNRPPRHPYNLRSKAKSVRKLCKVCGVSETDKHRLDPKSTGLCLRGQERKGNRRPFCIICLNTVGNKKYKKVQCGHRFHVKCIDSWLRESDSCPLCRYELRNSHSIIAVMRRLTLAPYLQFLF